MLEKGNDKMNALFNPGAAVAPPYTKDMEQFIRDKYERKVFMSEKDKRTLLQIMEQDRIRTTPSHCPLDISQMDKAKYEQSLRALREMGFEDPILNLVALKATNGNVQRAIDQLVISEAPPTTKTTTFTATTAAFRRPPASRGLTEEPLPSYPASTASKSLSSFQSSLLAKLNAMGFLNDSLNLEAMQNSNWKIEQAINYIVSKEENENSHAMTAPRPNSTIASSPTRSRAHHLPKPPNFMDSRSLNASATSLKAGVDHPPPQKQPTSSSVFDDLSGLSLESTVVPAQVPEMPSTNSAILDLYNQPTKANSKKAALATLVTDLPPLKHSQSHSARTSATDEFSDFISATHDISTSRSSHVASVEPQHDFLSTPPADSFTRSAPTTATQSPSTHSQGFYRQQQNTLIESESAKTFSNPASSVSLRPNLKGVDPFADLAASFSSFTMKKASSASSSSNPKPSTASSVKSPPAEQDHLDVFDPLR
jgi:trimeric autotransporter adhesin